MHQEPTARGLGRADAERIARSLRALADPTRVQLLALIVESPDARRSVTDLADALGLTQPTVSHHLRVMADEGLVERSQDGRLAWYSIAPTRMTEVVEAMRDDPVAAAVAPPVLERIASDLATRFAGTLSPETVDRYVRESYRLLAERAGSFVLAGDVLVEVLAQGCLVLVRQLADLLVGRRAFRRLRQGAVQRVHRVLVDGHLLPIQRGALAAQ